MSVAELPIPIDREQIARFCRERGIRKLSLFGSVLRHDFDPQRSDVDVLAEFEPGVLKTAGYRYFGNPIDPVPCMSTHEFATKRLSFAHKWA